MCLAASAISATANTAQRWKCRDVTVLANHRLYSILSHPSAKQNETKQGRKKSKRKDTVLYYILCAALSLSAPYSNRLVFVIITPGRHLLLLITAF